MSIEEKISSAAIGAVATGNTRPHQDAIEKIIGSFGKYQLILCLVIFLSKLLAAFHQMAIIFLSPKIHYTCPDTGKETCPCSNPEFNKSVFTHTIVTQWNLICERKWMVGLNQMLFHFGMLVGSVFFGIISDRYGRREPMFLGCVMLVIAGFACAFILEYWTYNLFRFLLGAAVSGTLVAGFVMVMEFIGSQYRALISALFQVPFSLGYLLLPLFGYFLRDYTYFQIGISIPSVVLLAYFLVPDTPAWFIAMKKTEKAIKIVTKVAKINKRPTENIPSEVQAYQALKEANALKKGTILDLFRTPNLRKNIIAMSCNWFSCSYCFYGVSQYVGQLSGNVFINDAASACFTLLGTLASIPLMKALGRRTIVIIFNFVGAVCLLILAVLPEGWGSVAFAIIGVVASFIVFVIVYLHCSEMFPTVVRSAALGFSSMIARVGAMVAPFVIDLRSHARWIPPVVFAIVPLIAGFVSFLLPETKGCELMTTIEEGERFGKKRNVRDGESSSSANQ